MRTILDSFMIFSKQLGFSDGLNDDRMIKILLDDQVALTFEVPEHGEIICFYSEIASEPENAPPEFYRKLLGLNLFKLSHMPTWLAVDETAKAVLIIGTVPGELVSAEGLANIVESISNEVLRLRTMLSTDQNCESDRETSADYSIRG